MALTKIELATEIKDMVEEVICQKCMQSTLIFESIDFDYNGSVVVKAACPPCKSTPYLIIENVPKVWW